MFVYQRVVPRKVNFLSNIRGGYFGAVETQVRNTEEVEDGDIGKMEIEVKTHTQEMQIGNVIFNNPKT